MPAQNTALDVAPITVALVQHGEYRQLPHEQKCNICCNVSVLAWQRSILHRTEMHQEYLVHGAEGLQVVPLGAGHEAASLTVLVVVIRFLLLHLGVFVSRVGDANQHHCSSMLVRKVDAFRHLQQQRKQL